MQRFFLALVAVACFAGSAAGQAAKPVVEARLLLSTDAVHAGSTARMAVVAAIASGYHINDHKPTFDYLIPTEVKLQPSPELSLKDVTYPKGTPQKFAFSDQPLSVYEGQLLVRAALEVAPGAEPGVYHLAGKLNYQACNDHACLAPTSAPLELAVRVVRAGVPLKPANSDVFKRTQSGRAGEASCGAK